MVRLWHRLMARKHSGPVRLKRVFIVQREPAFLEWLINALEEEEGLTVCGQSGTATEALEAVANLRPDLVLIDMRLADRRGPKLLRELKALDGEMKLLVVSMNDRGSYANRVLRAGGDGYIMRQEEPEEFIGAIRDVLEGHIYLSEAVLASGRMRQIKALPAGKVRASAELRDTGRLCGNRANRVAAPARGRSDAGCVRPTRGRSTLRRGDG